MTENPVVAKTLFSPDHPNGEAQIVAKELSDGRKGPAVFVAR
ncbi:MAG: hypothetical protein U9Q81_14235 [Pseudomonadota bacterium]|nr:hypothetical protein [Pseudomonadota bacterium]